MPDCTYCEESFEGEKAYLAHLRDAHGGELSRIDRRRVQQAAARAEDERSKLVVYGAVAVVVVLLAAAVYVTVLADDGETPIEAQPLPDRGDQALLQNVEEFPSEGNAHVSEDTLVDYQTSPPTSGPHYRTPADPGVYDEAPPAGNLVHSLEHGIVVIYYDPDSITPDTEESLRAFARYHDDVWSGVIVTPNPNPEPESPYVLTAWQAMLRMEEYDPEVVRAFLAEYIGRGPENPVR